MMRKSPSINNKNNEKQSEKLYAGTAICALVVIFEVLIRCKILPNRVLPAPSEILSTFIVSFPKMMPYASYTLGMSLLGFALSFVFGCAIAIVMDRYRMVDKTLSPILTISQSIPTIAIAPVYVLCFGYGLTPKLLVIISTCFFPIAINFLDGLKSADKDMLRMVKSMGAGNIKSFFMVKLPASLEGLFSGVRIAATYCIMGSVVAEWLGGDKGIGVYMIRVKRSYSYDKMFAAILLVVILSIALTYAVSFVKKNIITWKDTEK